MCLKVTHFFCFSLQYSLPAFQRPRFNSCLVIFLETRLASSAKMTFFPPLLPCNRNDVNKGVQREMCILQFVLRIVRSGDLAGPCWKEDLYPMQFLLRTSLLNLTAMSPVHLRHLSDHASMNLFEESCYLNRQNLLSYSQERKKGYYMLLRLLFNFSLKFWQCQCGTVLRSYQQFVIYS